MGLIEGGRGFQPSRAARLKGSRSFRLNVQNRAILAPVSTPPLRRCDLATFITLLSIAALSCRAPKPADEGRTLPGSGQKAPTPGRLPRANLTVRDRTDWRHVLKWDETCEKEFQSSRVAEDGGLVFHQIVPGVSLVEVLCSAGAYQPSFVIVRLDERSQTPVADVLSFLTYESTDGSSLEPAQQVEMTGEPSLLLEQRELTVLNVFRQTRDCGIWTRYGIRDGAPQLKEVRVRLPCPAGAGVPVSSEPGRPPRGWRLIASPPLR